MEVMHSLNIYKVIQRERGGDTVEREERGRKRKKERREARKRRK